MSQFKAGVARADITPPVGIAHGNWSAQVHERAEGIDLALWCTVLAAAEGDTEVIIAEWDLLYPPSGEWLALARRRITELTGVPGDHIRLSSVHTHSGPNLKKPWFAGGAEMVEPYVASLTDRLAGACLAAHRALRPARVAGGYGVCAVNCNRRRPWKPDRPLVAPNPDGFSDHQVGVIRIDDDEGKPISILVNFAAHPTILAWDNRMISSDYPGTLRRTVEGLTGATCLFLQGAAGNQDTIRDFSCKPEDARWVGRQIGLEAVRVAELIETQPTEMRIAKYVESSWSMAVMERAPVGTPDTRVACISRSVPVPIWKHEPPTDADAIKVKELEQRLADLRARSAPVEEIREANMRVRRASMDLNVRTRRSQGTNIQMEFQAIRLGPAALVGIPVEPFAEIGAEVKAKSPFATTFFSGYTNGSEGYMAMPYAYDEGGYEVWMTPFAPEAPAKVIAESLKLLTELHD
jgi:neutral ceramidase